MNANIQTINKGLQDLHKRALVDRTFQLAWKDLMATLITMRAELERLDNQHQVLLEHMPMEVRVKLQDQLEGKDTNNDRSEPNSGDNSPDEGSEGELDSSSTV